MARHIIPTVYIRVNKKFGTMYIGVTGNPSKRHFQHIEKHDPSNFVARYNLKLLVYMEHFETMGQAIARDKELKGWSRDRKLKLICEANPEWKNLEDWLFDLSLRK
jgi:putative endonuclease